MTVGMDLIKVKGATGDYFTDFGAKANACIEQLKHYDFGFCHIKAVDDAGHDRNTDKKIYFLQEIDKMLEAIVAAFLKDDENEVIFVFYKKMGFFFFTKQCIIKYTIVVTGDHSTPVLYGDHSCEPVPFCISKIGVERGDLVKTFDENAVSKGALGRFCGDQVMKIIKAFMNK